VARSPESARLVAESLALQEILEFRQFEALERAAADAFGPAQVKLALWHSVQRGELHDEGGLFEAAARGGNALARHVLTLAAAPGSAETALAQLLQSLTSRGELDGPALSLLAVRQAAAEGDLPHVVKALQLALQVFASLTPELAELIAAAVRLAEDRGLCFTGIEPGQVRAALQIRAAQGDCRAAYSLGRGLCGIANAALGAEVFEEGLNMRKGAAYLLRAADGGCDAAWLHLYHVHADHRLSVANAQMARFFLEKAAASGQAEAQLKLGAATLRDSVSLAETEQGIHWLHQAALRGESLARSLLASLVLDVEGPAEAARQAIAQIAESDPRLATRLQLARDFGLTKLEALCVDPTEGLRPWGLVVGRNPFIAQIRLAAPRAVPATTEAALAGARQAAAYFGKTRQEPGTFEGDLRRRALRQRKIFARLGLQESMFFARANSTTLEALRQGAKWALRVREPLRQALAA
jgi:TPR repeat protein